MAVRLSGEQETLRDTIAGLLTKESGTDRVRAAEPLGFDSRLWQRLNEFGVPGMALDAGLADLAVVANECGRRLAPAPVVETFVATRLLGRPLDDRIATVALHPAIDGVAPLVPAGAIAHTVVARDGDQVVAVTALPPAALPQTLGCSPLADRSLDGEREPVDPAAFSRALSEWRILTAAALAGLARGALALGVEYARTRRQFGVPIGSFQAVQQQLADVATAVEAAELLAFEAARRIDPALPSLAFAVAAETAARTAAVSLHVHGGYGFMLEYDIQLYFRRATAWALALGDPRAELVRAAPLVRPVPPDPEVAAFVARHFPAEARRRVHDSGTVHDWVTTIYAGTSEIQRSIIAERALGLPRSR